jgi:DNA invertase Pin-like site-specific DNA recombinase
MVLNIILVIAQWERETIAERTKEALAHKLRRGERCGKVKFGYDLAPDGKTLVPNQGEQAALALIVEWRRAGYTLRGIAAELDAMGIKAKGGKPWSMGSVARILARAA